MLAGGHGLERLLAMQMHGRGDVDGVDAAREQCISTRKRPRAELCGDLLVRRRVHIEHRRELGVGGLR